MADNLDGKINPDEEISEKGTTQKYMDWDRLLSAKTPDRRVTPRDYEFLGNYSQDPYETDYENIVSSSAFRRLQDKTQLFPLEKNDFVRTRLTHSIEVSAIARHLGIMVTNTKTRTKKDIPIVNVNKPLAKNSLKIRQSIPTILSCAGLIHDLGNPPFGHFGEDAIRDWFKDNKELTPYRDRNKKVRLGSRDILTPAQYADFCNFEGNAQAIRILSKVKYSPDDNTLNLTYALINTLMKYTEGSEAYESSLKGDDNDVKKHKLGYYQSEKDFIDEICTETTTKRPDGSYCRHPLTYLLEAADDIAYTTSDLEDTVKKGLLDINQFMQFYSRTRIGFEDPLLDSQGNRMPENAKEYDKLDKSADLCMSLQNDIYEEMVFFERYGDDTDFTTFHKWLGLVRQCMMYSVAYSYNLNYDKIMEGTFKNDLFEDGYHKYTVKVLKQAVHTYAHKSSGINKLELSAKKIIDSLLDDFVPAVIDWPDETPCAEGPTATHIRFQEILPVNLKTDYEKYVKDNHPDEKEKLYRRLLMVTDFISGMTDSYARDLYRELNGI